MILVLGGTSESREVISELKRAGYRVAASAVTAYGAELAAESGAELSLCGRLDEPGLERAVTELKAFALIDATHPFAQEVSDVARRVSQRLGRPYLRFQRGAAIIPDSPLVVREKDFGRAAERALELSGGGTVFLTIGTRRLDLFVRVCRSEARLAVRILPDPDGLRRCLELGLSQTQILAAQGPFSRQSNRQHFIDFGAKVVVTKDSGRRAGLAEKVWAALDLEIPIVIVEAPEAETEAAVEDLRKVLDFARRAAQPAEEDRF